MKRADIGVVVVIGETAEGRLHDAIRHVATLVSAGVLRAFWSVSSLAETSDESAEGRYHGTDGSIDVDLYASLAGRRFTKLRLASIAGPGDSAGALAASSVLGQLAGTLDALKAGQTELLSARVWLGSWTADGVPPVGYFSTSATANLVVLPEDRRSNAHAARQVDEDDGALFAQHAAIEVATQLGLWVGTSTAPIDAGEVGTIGFGQPRLHVVRSFARTAIGPPLPYATLADHGGVAPIPDGCREAPNQSAAAADLAEQTIALLEPLRFSPGPLPSPDRIQMSTREALVDVGRELLGFVRQLPSRIVRGMTRDMEEFAGRLVQTLVGESSVVEVVWRGKRGKMMPLDADIEAMVDDLREDAERRLRLQGGASIDQGMWSDVSTVVMGAIDGSDLPDGIEAPVIGGRRAVINMVEFVAPQPDSDAGGVVAEIEEPASHPTILSRLYARLSQILDHNERSLLGLFESIRADIGLLDQYRAPSVTLATAVGLVALAGLVVNALIFTGAVEGMGLLEISDLGRDAIWVIVTLLHIGVALAAFIYAERSVAPSKRRGRRGRHADDDGDAGPVEEEPHTSELRNMAIGLVGGGAIAIFFQAALAPFGYPLTGRTVTAAVVTLAAIGGTLGFLVDLSSATRNRTVATMYHMLAGSLIGYTSLVVIGLVVRPGGFYERLDRSERLDAMWQGSVSLVSTLAIAIVLVAWRRNQERTRLVTIGDRIRALIGRIDEALVSAHRADVARDQYVGTAVALAAVVWKPFGGGFTNEQEGVEVRDDELQKSQARTFALTERGEQALHGGLKRTMSEPGWIRHQYKLAVDAYRAEAAARLGASGSEAINRPDEEAFLARGLTLDQRWEKSHRYRFAKRLIEGEFSGQLSLSLERLDLDAVYSAVLADPLNLESVGEDVQDLDGFFGELTDGDCHPLALRYYTSTALADLPDRSLTRSVWWPAAGSRWPLNGGPDGDIDIIDAGGAGVVLVGLRSDWSPPYEPAILFDRPDDRPPEPPTIGDDPIL